MLAGRSAISPETNNWLTLGNEIAHSQNRKKTALLKELPAALNELDQGDVFFVSPTNTKPFADQPYACIFRTYGIG